MEISISYNSNKITKEIMTGTDIPSRKVSYVKASSRRVKIQESTCIGYFPVFIDDKLVFFFSFTPCSKNKYEATVNNIQMLQTMVY